MNDNTPKQCPVCRQPFLGEGPTCGSTSCGRVRPRRTREPIAIDEPWLRSLGFRPLGAGFVIEVRWDVHEQRLRVVRRTEGGEFGWYVFIGQQLANLEPLQLRSDLLRLIRLTTYRDWSPRGTAA